MMIKKSVYDDWSKEELIKEIVKIKSTTYGLVWHRDLPEEKIDILVNPDARTPNEMFPNELAGKPFPIFKEVKSKAIESDKSKLVNLIIEGDNYHSLAVLNFTHREAVDLIYIDPPYNTGNNDFSYNDKIVDTEDQYRHSKWLAFMEKRLKLGRNLLKESGMIFISIDDNEQAPLKLLCDEIFGEKNFINCISVKTKSSAGASGGGEDKKLKKHVEYLLFYAKDKTKFSYNPVYIYRDLAEIIRDKEENGKKFEYRQILLDLGDKEIFKTIQDGSGLDIKIFKHNRYKLTTVSRVMKDEKISQDEVYFKYFDKIFRGQPAQSSIRTRVNEATNNSKDLFSIEYTPRSGKRKNQIATNYYLKNDLVNWLSDTSRKIGERVEKYEKAGTLWDDLSWNGLSSEGGIEFKNGKKPISFIKRIISLSPAKDAVVVDFFAGSGSTGHAVLDLNKEDQQKRSFILCTNNENDICNQKTYPRLKNIIRGYKNKDSLGGNLKYYKTDFVEAEPTDKNKRKLVKESTDMICILENAFELIQETDEFKIFKNTDKYVGVIFYEDAIDNYKKAIKKIDGHFNTYVFSMGDDPHTKKFVDIKNKVTLCSIPEVILRVYREIFK